MLVFRSRHTPCAVTIVLVFECRLWLLGKDAFVVVVSNPRQQKAYTKITKIRARYFFGFCVCVLGLRLEKRPFEKALGAAKTRTQKTQKYLALIFVIFVYVFWASGLQNDLSKMVVGGSKSARKKRKNASPQRRSFKGTKDDTPKQRLPLFCFGVRRLDAD